MRATRSSAIAAIAVAALLAGGKRADAMEFSSKRLDAGVVAIRAFGVIEPGDSDRLMSVLVTLSPGDPKVLMLSSPGGSIVAAETLAATVHQHRMDAVVFGDGLCASSCFLVYAAGRLKMFGEGARIGIHSASGTDGETPVSMAMTTVMARTAAEFGVPDAVIGRMIRTAPGDIAWLSEAELGQMGATKLGPSKPATPPAAAPSDGAASASLPAKPQQAAPAPSTRAGVPPDPSSPAYQQGLADRSGWETWFGQLSGDAQLGAEYWTGERSKRQPGRCSGRSPEFQRGCTEARRLLDPSDLRRRAEPQYWWGWNSYAVTTTH